MSVLVGLAVYVQVSAMSGVSREGMWAMLGRFLGVYDLFKNSCECSGSL